MILESTSGRIRQLRAQRLKWRALTPVLDELAVIIKSQSRQRETTTDGAAWLLVLDFGRKVPFWACLTFFHSRRPRVGPCRRIAHWRVFKSTIKRRRT